MATDILAYQRFSLQQSVTINRMTGPDLSVMYSFRVMYI